MHIVRTRADEFSQAALPKANPRILERLTAINDVLIQGAHSKANCVRTEALSQKHKKSNQAMHGGKTAKLSDNLCNGESRKAAKIAPCMQVKHNRAGNSPQDQAENLPESWLQMRSGARKIDSARLWLLAQGIAKDSCQCSIAWRGAQTKLLLPGSLLRSTQSGADFAWLHPRHASCAALLPPCAHGMLLLQ